MRKLILTTNMSLDGYADHTVAIADDEMHEFFAALLDKTGIALFGRVTYEMMAGYWPNAHNDPRANVGMLKFADKFNAIPKIVFSKTLRAAEWNNTTLVSSDMVEEVRKLKSQDGKDLSIGGIVAAQSLMRAGLVDEYWLVVHPVVAGKGRLLFESAGTRLNLKLSGSRVLKSGAVALHYLTVPR
jgi:dihydrofolate reductase